MSSSISHKNRSWDYSKDHKQEATYMWCVLQGRFKGSKFEVPSSSDIEMLITEFDGIASKPLKWGPLRIFDCLKCLTFTLCAVVFIHRQLSMRHLKATSQLKFFYSMYQSVGFCLSLHDITVPWNASSLFRLSFKWQKDLQHVYQDSADSKSLHLSGCEQWATPAMVLSALTN